MKVKVLALLLMVAMVFTLAPVTMVYSYNSWSVEKTIDYLYNGGDFANAPVPEIAKGIDALLYEYEAVGQTAGYLYADSNFSRVEPLTVNLSKQQVLDYFEDVKDAMQDLNLESRVDADNLFDTTILALATALDDSGNAAFKEAIRDLFTSYSNVATELSELKNDTVALETYVDLVFGNPDIWNLNVVKKPTTQTGTGNNRPTGSFNGATQPPVIGPVGGDVVTSVVFNDIDASHWAYEYVEELSKAGVINGVGGQMFAPEAPLTRAAVVKMLSAIVGADVKATDLTFKDVPLDAWHNPYIAWGVANGIVTGYSYEEFAPDKSITREEIAAMTVRFMNKFSIFCPPVAEKVLFADDADIEAYAYDAVYTLQCGGIMNGKGDNMYKPQDNTTRAEAAKIFSLVSRLYK